MAVVVSLNEPDEIVKMLLKPLSLEIVNYEEQSRQMMPSELKRINSRAEVGGDVPLSVER
jgi:hypothetical protein